MKGPTDMPSTLTQTWIDSLMESIETGDLDDHLKEIAKACFLRGQAIGVIQQAKPAMPKKRVASNKKPKLTQDRKPPNRVTMPPAQQVDSAWWPVSPATNPLPNLRYVEHNGKKYLRAAFIGEQFVIQPGTYRTSKFDGMLATITGAGAQAFKVKFEPGAGGPTGPGQNNKGEVVFIDYRNAEYLFG